jgi:hypothetical protein
MTITIWNSKLLYRRLRDTRYDDIPSYFQDNFFRGRYYSEDQEIKIAKLPRKGRKLAAYVTPTEQGKPLAEFKPMSVTAYTPPYIKPKDAVRAVEASSPMPEEALDGPMTIEQRMNRRVGEVQDQHVRGINMQIAYQAARVTIDGALTVKYQKDQGAPHQEVTINFGRNANQTIVLAGPTDWADAAYPILDDVELWANRMQQAEYGQHPTVMLVGANVAPVFKKNTQVKEELNLQRRGTSVDVPTGIQLIGDALTFIGTLGSGIMVYAYRDYVEDHNGTLVDILNPNDVVLLAPGYEGTVAYGAIWDEAAIRNGMSQIDIFPKIGVQFDPGDVEIMHQSAPLCIPDYPNRSLKATVIVP